MTPSAEALEALRAACGENAVEEHAPVALAAAAPAWTLRPTSGETLARGLAACRDAGLAVLVRGAGTRLAAGPPPQRGDLLLSTDGLAGLRELDADEGVLSAGAGTPLAELRKAARDAGWELPFDPPGAGTTLGGALACAAEGPRFGHPRDFVLGLELAHPSGARSRCGGRVVKNVTGYDLAKLHLGARGGLGVIEAAWLRLRPPPRCVELLRADADLPGADPGARGGALREACRRVTVRAALRADPELAPELAEGAPLLLLELAGDESAVARDRAWLADRLGARPAAAAALERLREVQGGGAGGLRFALTALPTRLGATLETLHAAGARVLSQLRRGLLWAFFADPAGVASARAAVASAAEAAGGRWLLEGAPLGAPGPRGPQREGPEAALLAGLKRRHDPEQLLNPGLYP